MGDSGNRPQPREEQRAAAPPAPAAVAPDGVYRQAGEIVVRHIAGETVLVPIRGTLADMQKIFMLNPVGEHLWERLDGKTGLRELTEGVLEAFDATRDDAARDVSRFVGELLENDLIARVE